MRKNNNLLVKIRIKVRWFLLSPPGVLGGVETGQVSVLFDDVHLFRRPKQTQKG